jgi:bis(5'-nucleosyl)-tetraphosphatase (symmetrical)
MATYAIGDIQGCFDSLQHLLKNAASTRQAIDCGWSAIWSTADPGRSTPCASCVISAQQRITVLGNHDLYLLMVAAGSGRRSKGDTLDEILKAADCEELLDWLRQRPLCHREGGFCMVHAGLLPQWTTARARALAARSRGCTWWPDLPRFPRQHVG